jgi:uncharacterized protein Yka (UPF0111/DUF47 family)
MTNKTIKRFTQLLENADKAASELASFIRNTLQNSPKWENLQGGINDLTNAIDDAKQELHD